MRMRYVSWRMVRHSCYWYALIHEVTSPQAFGMLRDRGLSVRYPARTFATVDHIVPTNEAVEPYSDPLAQGMIEELRKNCAENNPNLF